jgi:hypothetical protein
VRTALVTGSAGFIGSFVCRRLIDDGFRVIGVDCMSDYYDVSLKERRNAQLLQSENYRFIEDKVETPDLLMSLFADEKPDVVIHLAAQAGVRYSIENPRSYLESNVIGTFELLEAARAYDTLLNPPFSGDKGVCAQALYNRYPWQYNLRSSASLNEPPGQIFVGSCYFSFVYKPNLQVARTTPREHLVTIDVPKSLKMLLPSLASGRVGKKGFTRNSQLGPNKVEHFFWNNLTLQEDAPWISQST